MNLENITARRWTVSDELTAREQENGALAVQAAAEGTVLLENDGILPLAPGSRAALWGCGCTFTVKGGTGSGEVNNRATKETLYYSGLQNVYRLTNQTYLDGYLEAYKKSRDRTISSDDPHALMQIGYYGVYYIGQEIPITEEALAETDPSDTAFFVVSRISGEGADRAAKKGDGDYFLSGLERANLEAVASYYDSVVVLLNMAAVMDTSFIREINAKKRGVIRAVVLAGQGGEFAGTALANILCGKESPSGKLTDTWPMDFMDLPSSATLGQAYDPAYPEKLYDEYYYDDIYVGYRYFDTFGAEPAYAFGFGLSYTTFSLDVKDVQADAQAVSVTVCVKNTGTCAGKEVVQIYCSAPDGKLEKPYQELAAFAKTDLLEPGMRQLLTLRFQTASLASYSEEAAAYVLEAGAYLLRVGNSSRDTVIAASLVLDQTVVTEQLSRQLIPDAKKARILEEGKVKKTAGAASLHFASDRAQRAAAPKILLRTAGFSTVNRASDADDEHVVSYVSANDPQTDSARYAKRGGWKAKKVHPVGVDGTTFGLTGFDEETDKAPETLQKVETKPGATLADVRLGRISMESFVAGLSVEELSYLVNGVDGDKRYGISYARENDLSDMQSWDGSSLGNSLGFLANYAPGTVWASTGRYYNSRLIPSVNLPDGPAGPRLAQRGTRKLYRAGSQRTVSPDHTFLAQDAEIQASEETFYQFATAWPVGCMLAQTWNQELLWNVGKAYGQELHEFSCTLLLGPGMNIHRTPLCGRNFEYFSEDPVVSGLIASSLILGAQSNDGVGFTIKHFSGNNNENGRTFTNDVVSERAMREIYLKGFEIALKTAQPMALMTSYNLINGTYSVNNYDLLTDICRREWGFRGVVMSDYGAANQAQCNTELSLNPWANIMHAGNDWIMGGSPASIRPETDAYGSRHDQSFQQLILGGERAAMPLGDLQKCAMAVLRTLMYSNKFGDDMVNWVDPKIVTPPQIADLASIHNGPYNDLMADVLETYLTVEKQTAKA